MPAAKFAHCELKGMDTVLVWMKDIQAQMNKVPQVFLQEVAEHAVARSRLNAPILTGILRNDIKHSAPAISVRGVSSVDITSSVINPKTKKDYALIQHEFQVFGKPRGIAVAPPKDAHWLTPPRPLQHGKKTAAQPMTVEGGAGGKYIERVVYYNFAKYYALLQRMVNRALRAGDVSQFVGSLK